MYVHQFSEKPADTKNTERPSYLQRVHTSQKLSDKNWFTHGVQSLHTWKFYPDVFVREINAIAYI